MDLYLTLCVVLCVVSGSSPASLRSPRQVWRDSFMEHGHDQEHDHFHFPDQPVPERMDRDDFGNEILGFPDTMTRPGGMGNVDFGPGFRPRPTGSNGQWSSNQRPTGGNSQIPDFSNNPWLNGINGQRPGGSNNLRPSGSNSQRPNGNNSQRPSGGNSQRPNSSNNQQRPTSSTTPSTTTDRTSTPRTFHLAPEGCDCPSTPQFNPVCGTDGNTYKNAGLLKCFRLCGIDVSQRRMGAC